VRTLLLTLGLCAALSLGQTKQAEKQSDKQTAQALYVVTYVDVYPNFAPDTVAALQKFRAASMKDKGAVRYEFLRDTSRVNHFAIVEQWQSREAYEAHLTQPHSREFREKIQPWLGSPFDERLYNAVQ
jgi:quinol monooxygenase YgiN